MATSRKYVSLGVAMILLLLLFVAAVGAGRFGLSYDKVVQILLHPLWGGSVHWTPQEESVVYSLRLPRVLLAILIGASLSLSGAVYQSVFRNPLVAPDILGVSTGACVGASLCILAGLATSGVQVGAFVGGILAVACATLIPRLVRRNSVIVLVLSGIIVGGVMFSILGFIKFVADTETELPAITYWQLGSLSNAQWHDVWTCILPMALAMLLLFLVRWQMNILSLSEEEVHMLLRHPKYLRYMVIACATLLTASAVSISGTIGWIGLVIPHLARLLVGADNRYSLPMAGVAGAIFLLLIDTLARTLTAAEIPLSVLTGIIGAPFYCYLLIRKRMAV